MMSFLECNGSYSNIWLIFCSLLLLHCMSSLFLLSPIPSVLSAPVVHNGNNTDREALLAIKARIVDDPLGLTSSWNNSVHFCNWHGVTCGHLHQRVTNLNLSSLNLLGTLSPYIGNLTFLSGINLEHNNFHGEIPHEISCLYRLKHLNLINNSFSGEIPWSLSNCSNLVVFRLGWNQLSGRIPIALGSLQKLESLELHYNTISGSIPETFGNLSSIKSISLAANNLQGYMPDVLAHLQTLNFLGLGSNDLSGMIPMPVLNLSSLVTFSVPYNKLSGSLPSDIGLTLPSLQVLNVGHNPLTGPLPKSLSNASYLVELDVTGSNFTGKLAIDFGGLPNLWWLTLASNPLGLGQSDDLSFFDSLSRCRNLKMMDLSGCQFSGIMPSSIANLSTNLWSLRLGENQLLGSIPDGIQNLIKLTELQLQRNRLAGGVPASIGNLKMLHSLDLSTNELSGSMPPSLSNLSQLYALYLEDNLLHGSIPNAFGDFQHLQVLDLSQNLLNGSIPQELLSLSSLTVSLNLSKNQLSGVIPQGIGNLVNLVQLDISENMLSGEIPSSISNCAKLERLDMSNNLFGGSIPSSFESLKGLEDLDLSRNNFTGQLPVFLGELSLKKLNLSLNNFEGQVPTEGIFADASAVSIAGNSKLCGGVPGLKLLECPMKNLKKRDHSPGVKLVIPLLFGVLALVLVMSLVIIIRLREVKSQPSYQSVSAKSLFLKVNYEVLFKATNGFSPANLLGTGNYGSVYKGILDSDEKVYAIKVFHIHQQGPFKSFTAECKSLSNTCHRNLLKIYAACSSFDFQGNEFKALVYEFMPNGSLESWLHPSPEAGYGNDQRTLDLLQRLNISIDVASALDHLHHHCHKPIIHSDLKPGNILLDDELTAHVGDFGIAKFFSQTSGKSHSSQSSSIGSGGTIGYAAPEYGTGEKESTLGDIYSYGILLLEIFTGKRPTDSIFKDGMSLHSSVERALPHQIFEILDQVIVPKRGENEEESIISEKIGAGHMMVDQERECLISILRIGVACSVESAEDRMDISDVMKELQFIKDILLAGTCLGSTSGSLRFEGSSSRSASYSWRNVL